MIVVCSYCQRQRCSGQWIVALPPPVGTLVSHGICEECYNKVMEELDKEEVKNVR
jgi:hypothetical protein